MNTLFRQRKPKYRQGIRLVKPFTAEKELNSTTLEYYLEKLVELVEKFGADEQYARRELRQAIDFEFELFQVHKI